MALASPKLDDRDFQQIVDEAKKRIPHYTPEWTDHNVSDPGVTLIELFAWMTETVLYRLNQVPDLHAINFLNMLGIQLVPPLPASAIVSFWLTKPVDSPITIAQGTEVASTQTETEPSIVFTTDEPLVIEPPALDAIVSRIAGRKMDEKRYNPHKVSNLQAGVSGIDIFTEAPQIDDAIYFGFKENVGLRIVGFNFDFDSAGGAGVNPNLPPYIWEASTGDAAERWRPCAVDVDSTRSFNRGGDVKLHTPKMGSYPVNGQRLYWIRARVKTLSDDDEERGVRPFSISPRLRRAAATAWGGSISATHSQVVSKELLGRSDGSAGQRFALQKTPVLKRTEAETVIVHKENGDEESWTEVRDFADSHFADKHYTLDSVTGEVRFGPAVRQPDGTLKVYGSIPARNANVYFSTYRTGGGTEGNVRGGVLNTLKTSIPFVDKISNRLPAQGGMDAEALDAAMLRAPQLLRSRQRAVTDTDYEFLAREALPDQISRVKCIQPQPSAAGRVQPGRIFVLVLPRISYPNRLLKAEELEMPEELIERLRDYLDARRLLTVRLDVRPPEYRGVAVKLQIRATPGSDQLTVEQAILARLYTFLNPITGGADGDGWPFGRNLFMSDVYQCLQGMPNVQFTRNLEMFAAPVGGTAQGSALEELDVLSYGTIASGLHEIEFV